MSGLHIGVKQRKRSENGQSKASAKRLMYADKTPHMQARAQVCKASRVDLLTQEQSYVCISTSYIHKLEPTHAEAQIESVLRHFHSYIIQNQS